MLVGNHNSCENLAVYTYALCISPFEFINIRTGHNLHLQILKTQIGQIPKIARFQKIPDYSMAFSGSDSKQ